MEAVLYLYEHNFTHGDIRLANVLLFSHTVDPRSFEIKLIPPELINSAFELSGAAPEPNRAIFHPRNRKINDLYSLGITCIQILCFGAIPTESDINNIRSNDPTLPVFEEHFKKKEQQKEYVNIIKELFLIVRDCIDQSLELVDGSQLCQFLLNAIKKIVGLMELAKDKPQIALNEVFAPAFEKELSTFKYNVIPLNELFDTLSTERSPRKRKGNFGEVFFREWRKGENSQMVALKRLKHGPDDQLSLTRLTHEFIIWANLKHDNSKPPITHTYYNNICFYNLFSCSCKHLRFNLAGCPPIYRNGMCRMWFNIRGFVKGIQPKKSRVFPNHGFFVDSSDEWNEIFIRT